MVASTAYLLISHGSRDPRPQEAMNRLADLVRENLEAQSPASAASTVKLDSPRTVLDNRSHSHSPSEGALKSQIGGQLDAPVSGELGSPSHQQTLKKVAADLLKQTKEAQSKTLLLTKPRLAVATPNSSKVIVGTACLELTAIPLSEQVYAFGRRLRAAGVKELKLLPVFLMSGVHVMEDIPEEVAAAKELLGNSIELTLCPHLGSHSKIVEVLSNRLTSVPAEGSLLVAHGSRRPKGNKAIMGLAKRLNTAVAYWATPPDIETQVIELMQAGCQRLTILPYFLFAGGITDAITHRTEELAERFPKVKFRLLPTLGATPEIADLAVEILSP
ncbi:MAG: sirohydrochlorin chelatase [Cyanobacteria bacterium J06598_3]